MRGPTRLLFLGVASLALGACGSDPKPAAAPPFTPSAPVSKTAIPDSIGRLVEPKPSGSTDPQKSLVVPDAGGSTDFVSPADAVFLARARPAVAYSTPERTVTNATLIAMGHKACDPTVSYTAGGITISGDAAAAVHAAALSAYC